MNDRPSPRKVLLNSCWLVGALCMHSALADNRQWYRLSIDGDRVGYAWHDRVLQSGQYIDSEVTRVEVEELRKRLTVEMRTTVMRSAEGTATEIHVDSLIGSERNGWLGRFAPDGQALNVSVARAPGARPY